MLSSRRWLLHWLPLLRNVAAALLQYAADSCCWRGGADWCCQHVAAAACTAPRDSDASHARASWPGLPQQPGFNKVRNGRAPSTIGSPQRKGFIDKMRPRNFRCANQARQHTSW